MAQKRKTQRAFEVEVVHFALYDIGVDIDLKRASNILPCRTDEGRIKRRDAPASLMLPKPLIVPIDPFPGPISAAACAEPMAVPGFSAAVKLFDEGVVSIMVRKRVTATLDELHNFVEQPFKLGDVTTSIADYVETKAQSIVGIIRPAVGHEGYGSGGIHERESYTAYCFTDVEGTPDDFVSANAAAFTTLLSGEDVGIPLHDTQVQTTLDTPFRYRRDDYALFDIDRCVIIDAQRDYEDLLLIIENANYQLLELRALDRLLDRWLDEAESDLRTVFIDRPRKRMLRSLPVKFADMQALRIEALFILENLENSSKIIGDYYFGQIYNHLCETFNTAGWKWSVERRLDALQNIYEIVKGDIAEQRSLLLEIIFIVVCIIFPIIQIVQVMLSAS